MTEKEAQKKIVELSTEINRHNELYYLKDKPEISDYDFDKLLEQLLKLEAEFPKDTMSEQLNAELETIEAHDDVASRSQSWSTVVEWTSQQS